jgi:hypothetical protein
MVPDPDAVDIARVADEDMVPDAAAAGLLGGGEFLRQDVELTDQFRPVPVHGHDIGRLGVEPVKCIGVEDSYNGVRSIVAAGMRAVMVPDLLKPNDEMKKIAWRIDETLFDFLHMLSGKE